MSNKIESEPKISMMSTARAIGAVAVGATVLYSGVAYLCFRLIFGRQQKEDCYLDEDSPVYIHIEPYLDQMQAGFDWVEQQPKQVCSISSFDGLKLYGDFFENPGSRKVLLLMHGYRSSYRNDFACAMPWFYRQGFHILAVDQRAQGRSEGKYITFGIQERWDCVRWAEYIAEKLGPDCEIFIQGISMGAATVLMASELPLPKQVRGVIADCPFTSPREIIRRTALTKLNFNPDQIMPGLEWYCKKIGHFDLDAGDTRKAVAVNQLPMLLIHGEGDKFVPCYMSEETYRAARTGYKRFLHVPGAGHGQSYLVDQVQCREALRSFWKHCEDIRE